MKKFSKIQQGGSAVFQACAVGTGTVTHVQVNAYMDGKRANDAFDLISVEEWSGLCPDSRKKIIYSFMGVNGDFSGDDPTKKAVKRNADAVLATIDEVVLG